MVKMGPDVVSGDDDALAGYLPEGEINGFSMLHLSGGDGTPTYGVVSQMPVGKGVQSVGWDDVVRDTRQGPDDAVVGYYKTALKSGVTVELAAAHKSGIYHYRWPNPGPPRPTIVVDVHHVLRSHTNKDFGQRYRHGMLEVTNQGRSYVGSASFDNVSLSLYLSERGSLSQYAVRGTLTVPGMEPSQSLDRLLLRSF